MLVSVSARCLPEAAPPSPGECDLTLADTRGISYLPDLAETQYFWRLLCPDPGWGLRGGARCREGWLSKKLKVEAERGVSRTIGRPGSEDLAAQLLLRKKGWELPFP